MNRTEVHGRRRPGCRGDGYRRLLRGVVLALLAGATGCGSPTPPAPVDAGPRVISLVPSATEILFAVGAGPQVVGVSSFDERPAAVRDLPRVGALLDPDLEKILSLKPDLVVTYGSQQALEQQLAQAGVATFTVRHGGLGDTLQTMEALAARTGHEATGREAANILRARLGAVRMRVEGQPRPQALLVFGREAGTLRQVWASGGSGFLHDLLDVAGADNVFADTPRENVQASTEMLLARAPEVIVELRRTGAGTSLDRAWAALASVPAVRDGRVLEIDGSDFVVPGPRLADAAEQLARALHPTVFDK